jgi:hypothetical protein
MKMLVADIYIYSDTADSSVKYGFSLNVLSEFPIQNNGRVQYKWEEIYPIVVNSVS